MSLLTRSLFGIKSRSKSARKDGESDTVGFRRHSSNLRGRRDAPVRIATARARNDIGGLIAALGDRDDASYKAAAGALIDVGAAAVVPLIETLRDPGGDWLRRKNAAVVLGRLRAREAAPVLVRCLADGNRNVQQGACWGLAHLGDRGAVPALIDVVLGEHATLFTRGVAMAALLEVTEPDVPDNVVATIVSLVERVAAWNSELLRDVIPDELGEDARNAEVIAAELVAAGRGRPLRHADLVRAVSNDLAGFADHVLRKVLRRLGERVRAPLEELRAKKGDDPLVRRYVTVALEELK